MLFRQFCRLRATISRGWSWHSVPDSKRRGAFPSIPSNDFRMILAQPSSLRHQQRSDKMVSFRDYEIYLLFLLLVKFHVSGKCDIYSPVQRILQCFSPCVILSVDTENADPLFLNVIFVKMVSELLVGINSFCISKLDMMLGLQSRDKWSLNNCNAIEIKSIVFYASNVTIPYFQNLTLTLKEGGIGAH